MGHKDIVLTSVSVRLAQLLLVGMDEVDNGCVHGCRGLLGLRNAMLTATKGTAILNTIFKEYGAWCGEINTRETGSLVGHETGQVSLCCTALTHGPLPAHQRACVCMHLCVRACVDARPCEYLHVCACVHKRRCFGPSASCVFGYVSNAAVSESGLGASIPGRGPGSSNRNRGFVESVVLQ
jgi:hypothetical protein